jgi:hypothetical protein
MRFTQIPISQPAAGKWPVFLYAGVPLLITGLLWASSRYDLSVTQVLASFLLCWIPWAAYQQWSSGDRDGLPLFALIATMYWLAYALPLFWSDHGIGLVTGFRVLSEDAITESLCLAVIGVVSLWAGMKVAKRWQGVPSIQLDVPDNPWRWFYLRLALVASAAMKIFVPITALGDQWRQIIVNVEVIVPTVTFVILLRYYLRGKAIGADKVLLAGYVLVAVVVGLSSGWLGSFVGLGIVCIAAYLCEKRKLPLTAILVILPIVLFLQPGKARFREKYWRNGVTESYSESYAERIGFWVEASSEAWADALTNPGGGGFGKLSGETLTRVSLLQQTANVIEMTPGQVPFQGGRMYSYLVVTFIPRSLWPDKPSANDANRWYQVSYHLTLPSDLVSVGMAVGSATESYISFGWYGPPFVMFCLGLVLRVFEKFLLQVKSGLLLSSIGVALLPGLMSIESQMAVYISGLLQQILFAVVVLAPVLELTPNRNRGRGIAQPPYPYTDVKARPPFR